MCRLLALAALVGAVATAQPIGQAAGWQLYRDPQGRFAFEYPTNFGVPGPGTDDGFHGRVAVVRLPAVNAEALLTTGPVLVDRQALGGLYDEIALQLFRDADRAVVASLVPAITADTFCAALAAPDHASGLAFPERLRVVASRVDRFGNTDPVVHTCVRTNTVIRFDKDVRLDLATSPVRRHVVGAIRFLDGPYSSFQIIGVSPAAVADDTLHAMERLVTSFGNRLS